MEPIPEPREPPRPYRERPFWLNLIIACGGYAIVLGAFMLGSWLLGVGCRAVMPKPERPKNLYKIFEGPSDDYPDEVWHEDSDVHR